METLNISRVREGINTFLPYLEKQAMSEKYRLLLYNSIRMAFIRIGGTEITQNDISEFLVSLLVKKKKRCHYFRHAFIHFFNHLGIPNWSQCLPKTVMLPNKASGNYYPKEKLIEIINAFESPKWRLVASIQFDTGLRTSEILSIERPNIKYDQSGNLTIYSIGKGEKNNISFVSRKTEDALKMWLDYTDAFYIFLNSKSIDLRRAIETNGRYYRKALYKASKNVFGVPKMTTHDFRRNIAADIYNKTKDIYQIKGFLNHSRIATSIKYIEGVKTDKKEVIKKVRE